MKIEIWSDFACPYCYIGEKKLEKALKELDKQQDVEFSFKSYQLNTDAIKREGEDLSALIAKKYSIPYESAKNQIDNITQTAAELGLDYRFDIQIQNNTSLAHQATKYAKKQGLEKQFVDRFFKAYFEEGSDIGDMDTILKLSSEIGLDSIQLKKTLEEKTFLQEVDKDQNKAMGLGIQGVPFFIIDSKETISGAQSVDHFKEVLKRASGF